MIKSRASPTEALQRVDFKHLFQVMRSFSGGVDGAAWNTCRNLQQMSGMRSMQAVSYRQRLV
jgi:hypothetical protein